MENTKAKEKIRKTKSWSFEKTSKMDKSSTALTKKKIDTRGTSLVVQWVRLPASNAEGLDLIPGQGTRSRMHATTKKSTCHN